MANLLDYQKKEVLEERAKFFAELALGRKTRVTFSSEYSEDENLRYYTFVPNDPDGELLPTNPIKYDELTLELEASVLDKSEEAAARREEIHNELRDLTRAATSIFVSLSYMLDADDMELEEDNWWFSKLIPGSQADLDEKADKAFLALTEAEKNFITGNDVPDSWMPPGSESSEITDGLESPINEDPTMEEYLNGDDLPDDDGKGIDWNDSSAGAPYFENYRPY